MNLSTVKWAQWDKQNPIQRTVSLFICVCIALCTIAAHNIAQNRPDSFPSYPPDITTAPMMSIWGKGACVSARTDGQRPSARLWPMLCELVHQGRVRVVRRLQQAVQHLLPRRRSARRRRRPAVVGLVGRGPTWRQLCCTYTSRISVQEAKFCCSAMKVFQWVYC